MRLVPTGNPSNPHEVMEVYRDDLGNCGCGLPFHRRGVALGLLRCDCAGRNHRTFYCRACRQTEYDPPHVPGSQPWGDRFGYAKITCEVQARGECQCLIPGNPMHDTGPWPRSLRDE